MSYDFNYKFWLATASELKDALLTQKAYEKLKPITERPVGHTIFAEIFAQYVELVNKLGYIFPRTLQVQKRALITKLIQAASSRLIELKTELKKMEFSEFIYVDKTLIQKKLMPEDVQLLRPPYFPFYRPPEVQALLTEPRKEEVKELTPEEAEEALRRARRPKTEVVEIVITPEQKLFTQSVNIIQAHERARVARVFQTNIRLHPDQYKPQPAHSGGGGIKYQFTHKPDQAMLILVKRTKYDANYFIERKTVENFNYYVRPVHRVLKKIKEEEEEDMDGDIAGEHEDDIVKKSTSDMLQKFMGPHPLSTKQVYDEESPQVEEYFLEGFFHKSFSTIYIKPKSETEFRRNQALYKLKRAATVIQRTWRAHKAYQKQKERELLVKKLCGMASTRKRRINPIPEIHKRGRDVQAKAEIFEADFIQAMEDEKSRILEVKTPWIMEDITDHIRAWFYEFYNELEAFHPYPDVLDGGTLLLLTGETMTTKEYRVEMKKKPLTKEDIKKLKKKEKALKMKMKKQAEKLKKAEERKAKQIAARGGVYYDFKESNPKNKNLVAIEEQMFEYDTEWRYVDEKNNTKEAPFMEWISLDKYAEVHQELRVVVDELMRIEFELLRRALAKDQKVTYVATKKKKEKKKKKKGKKGKKGKKDPTGDRTIESLFYEMQDMGLIKDYKRRHFEEFFGDYNYCAYEIRNYFLLDSMPSLGEVRDIFREWILGMGPLDLQKYRSICIAGPPESGKHQLSEILASEIDAVVIDLSPENILKFHDDMPYLIHLVTKMAKILQPTIIQIHGVHRLFWKKVPPDSQYLKPLLLGKSLAKKIIKPIKANDKIFVLGTTDLPWTAKGKMNKIFERAILLPRMDYASSFLLWRAFCLDYLGVPRDFEFSALAMVTRAYSSGAIYKNVKNTIDIERRMNFSRKPLDCREFVETFLKALMFSPDDATSEKYQKWFNKANKLAKERVKYMKTLDAVRGKKK